MEQEKNKNEIKVQNKSTKKLLLIVCICLVMLFIGLFIILKLSNVILDSDDDYFPQINDESDQNNLSNESNQNNLSNESDQNNLSNEEYSYHINVNENSLYVDIMEKNYTNYSKLTEITYHGIKYYIEKGKLFKNENDVISEVDIDSETAKFIASGWSGCSGNELMILTVEGNIYSIDMNFNVSKKYSGGNAKEILYVNNEPQMFSTCSTFVAYALIDEKLYRLPYSTDGKISERSISHPYSFIIDDGSLEDNRLQYLLYPDGSMNKYVYFHDMRSRDMPKIQNSFIKDESLKENENKLISFIFQLDSNYYLVDIHGHIYRIIRPQNVSDNGYTDVSLVTEPSLVNNKNIKSIDLYYSSKKDIKTNNTISHTEEIIFNLEDGSKKVYSTDNNDKISFNSTYYFTKYYSNMSN